MAILVFSDTHFDNHTAFARPGMDDKEFAGCNSRMLDILNAAKRAYQAAAEREIKTVVIPGDIFHRRGIVPVPVFNAVAKVMEWARDTLDIRTIVIPGNHDFVDRHARFADQALHSLYSLAGAMVINEPSLVGVSPDLTLAFIPYTADRQAWLDAADLLAKTPAAKGENILFAHQSFDGARVGPHEYVMREGINPRDIPAGFKQIISGHYHEYQTLYGDWPNEKVTYVGGLVQHNFGERTYKPGWLIINDDLTLTHHEDMKSPRFRVIETNSEEALKGEVPEHDFVQIRWTGAPNRELIDMYPDAMWQQLGPEQHHTRLEVSVADPVNEMLKKYITHVRGDSPSVGEISEAELLEVGLKFFEEGRRNRSV